MTEKSSNTPDPAEAPAAPRPTGASILQEIRDSSITVTVLAIVVALVLGGVLIAVTDPATQDSAKYFFGRPLDTVSAAWTAVSDAYVAMFRGAVFDPDATSAVGAIYPLTETLTLSVPLILAGLGVAIGFRAGLFNIGAQGQVVIGALVAGWIGFHYHLPIGVHLLVALFGAVAAGAFWAGIAGFLKARFGAHEVITTIMLNYIIAFFLDFLLGESGFTGSDSGQPKSPAVDHSAILPLLLGQNFRLHAGFLLALLAAVGFFWLMNRSTLGFKFRAVGENPAAARTAGINVALTSFLVMVFSGALVGLGGAAQILGTERALTGGIGGTIGFDALTVALLGRSRALGTVLAGLLFGALSAGGRLMQIQTGTPIDIVQVVQSVIVLLIAAPPLVKAIFRLNPKRGSAQRATKDGADDESGANAVGIGAGAEKDGAKI